MFNALNRFISRLDGDPNSLPSSSPSPSDRNGGGGQDSYGFQVLRNTNMALAVEPFFDFIVGINGRVIDNPEPGLFAQEVRNCAGGVLSLGLWSAKGQRTREIHVTVPADTASLGLTLQWTPLAVAANIWHVLDVPSNSPADLAGLLPYGDYILGSPEGVLHGEGGLGELVEDHIGRPMRLYVYNNEFDVTREVTVQPSRDWGGAGALGCMLGYGALHRLPAPLSEPVDAPGETMFDGGEGGDGVGLGVGQAGGAGTDPSAFVPAMVSSPGDMIVPADLTAPPPAGPAVLSPPPSTGGSTLTPSVAPARGKKKDRHHKPNSFMDDYLREEEQKSREVDRAPSGRATPAPPPPRAGGGSIPPPPQGGPPLASPHTSPPPASPPPAGDGGLAGDQE